VRAAADWLEAAVDHGEFTLDKQLAQLLKRRVAMPRSGRPLAEYYGDLVRTSLMEAGLGSTAEPYGHLADEPTRDLQRFGGFVPVVVPARR
jgi:hypothetical protein